MKFLNYDKRKFKIFIAIIIVIVLLIVVKTGISLYNEYSCTITIDDADIRKFVNQRISNIENLKIIDKQEEKGYVACLITYTQYEEELVGCVYLETSKILKNRYYAMGIGDGVARGKLGEYKISSIGNARIVMYGLDLPNEADKYSINFFEYDKELIVDIFDNKIFELYVIEDDIDSFINCESKLLDSNYNVIKDLTE